MANVPFIIKTIIGHKPTVRHIGRDIVSDKCFRKYKILTESFTSLNNCPVISDDRTQETISSADCVLADGFSV